MPRDQQWRTAVWHGDLPLSLNFPEEWNVTFLWPDTPAPMTDDQIAAALDRSSAHAPIRQLAKGKKRPVIMVDDPNRPTPVARLMPAVLRRLQEAGIPAEDVTILVATGTHGAPRQQVLEQKLGPEAASTCRILVHDSKSDNLVKIGSTTFGTPVLVNPAVMDSDFVLGIGGIYPNHTAGFGGGTKLALGVLGFKTIERLHYHHQSLGWGADPEATFRQDLNEIARMLSLHTIISVQVDAQRNIVRLAYGDPQRYFAEEVTFARRTFSAPMPGDTDVVICNAYPNDLSLTFALMKGITPLYHCRPGASRVALAYCGDGPGEHGLFPLQHSRFDRPRHILRRARMMSLHDLSHKVGSRLRHGIHSRDQAGSQIAQNPIWVYRPGSHAEPLPAQVRDARITSSWSEVVAAISKEQSHPRRLKVMVYPCAPLQTLEPQPARAFAPQAVAALEKKSA